MTYEFVLEERYRYVVLGDGDTPELAEDDAVERLMRFAKRGEAIPITYKLKVVKRESLGDIKRTTQVVKENKTGSP